MKQSVIVIGTILMDCKGFAETQYLPQAKNLGSIRFIHGGVGRNVTENLARIGIHASMASTVNADGNGRDIVEHLQSCGADTEYILQVPARGMGLWMAILDEHGHLVGSISDMPDLAGLERLIHEQGNEMISASSHVVLVLDLNERLTKNILEIAARLNKPVYGLPSNFSVIHAHPEVLEGLECFICNEIEGQRLLGCEPLITLDKDVILGLFYDPITCGGEWEEVRLPERLPMPMEQWALAIEAGDQPSIGKRDAVLLTLFNEAAVESHRTGCRVQL